MSMDSAVQPVRGRAGYAGFRAMIKAVATGPRGSRDLTFDEAREATGALLAGEVSPAQAGGVLLGVRGKGEGSHRGGGGGGGVGLPAGRAAAGGRPAPAAPAGAPRR